MYVYMKCVRTHQSIIAHPHTSPSSHIITHPTPIPYPSPPPSIPPGTKLLCQSRKHRPSRRGPTHFSSASSGCQQWARCIPYRLYSGTVQYNAMQYNAIQFLPTHPLIPVSPCFPTTPIHPTHTPPPPCNRCFVVLVYLCGSHTPPLDM